MDVFVAVVKADVSASNPKEKPAVPKKPVNLTPENDAIRKTHVRDMIRKLQEKEQANSKAKANFVRKPGKSSAAPEKEEVSAQASSQTLEDLRAIDEDIEKLRKQIEERDKIISALREAAEAKDKKLDNLIVEYSKLQSNGKLDMDTTAEPNRATSSSPSSPPLCNGELCWTDSFVNKNYREPVYAQLYNDHTALQKVYNDLRTRFESKNGSEEPEKTMESRRSDAETKPEGGENAINLIMAEQIRALKEREAQLIWEAEELREQNDLMEFRILELEECRKEFLDKELMNEGKHRGEKIVWRERDIEEVSDSGVMSLPTSEDLTSDSELGEAIRNYSPLGPVTNLGLTAPDNSHSEHGIGELKSKKSLKPSECLQESGNFVDSESSSSECGIPAGTHSKACQTESVLDKTLLDIIDSSCDLFLSRNPGYLEDSKSDDLSTEISKLSVIQKRIQQKTKSSPPQPRSPHTVSCPHSNSLLFYEERLGQLEDKLKIYESSGDAQDILLAKRLQKEVELAHRVKELTDRVNSLEARNKKLEEEKCEFEEAENDTRFQCQRLEIRLQELIDKNTELELEIERQKVIMNEERRRERKKGSLEGLLNKYEQRNFELEEKELETRQRLSMIEAAMPAIVAYNVFKLVQNSKFTPVTTDADEEDVVQDKGVQLTDPVVFQRLEEVLKDQKKLRKEYKKVAETAADKERALRNKIEELEAKAAKDREMLEEMTNSLKAFKWAEKNERKLGGSGQEDLFEELKHMVANEIQLRAQIERLEKKEQAYMQSLEEADEIWAGMEADYKRRLKEVDEANSELQKRVAQLEATQEELQKALSLQSLQQLSPKVKDEGINFQEIVSENEKLKKEISRNLDEKFEDHKKFLEVENLSLKEELKKMKIESTKGERNYYQLKRELEETKEELQREKESNEKMRKELENKTNSVASLEVNMQEKICDLTQELKQKSQELSSLEVTVAELREEVETLENKVSELVETIQMTIKNQEEGSSKTAFLKESLQWSAPVEEQLHPVSVCLHNPFRNDAVKSILQEIPASVEFIVKKEKQLPTFQVLIPSKDRFQFIVFAALTCPRQRIQFTFSSSRIFSVLIPVLGTSRAVFLTVPVKETNKGPDPREEEIFQLSLKNTELQQTLERMEEESKLKDREFEKLLKIAMEIRREQEHLQALYHELGKTKEENREAKEEEVTPAACEHEENAVEKPRRVPTTEVGPVSNASEQNLSTLSSLPIALDNLHSKYRSKTFLAKPLLDQLNQKGDSREIDDITRHPSLQLSSDTDQRIQTRPNECTLTPEDNTEEVHVETDFRQTKTVSSDRSGRSLYASGPVPPKRFSLKSVEVDPNLSFVAPITTIRRVGDDGLFLEWDLAHQPPNVTGFQIKVNGLPTHRVRSSSRNKALLRPLDLNRKISIHVFAVSENGRSTESSHVTYPDKYFLESKE